MFTPGEEQTTDPLEAPTEVNKKAVKLSPFWAFLSNVPQIPDVVQALRYRILYLELQVEELKAQNKRLNLVVSFAERAYAQARREVRAALALYKELRDHRLKNRRFCMPS